MRKKRHTEETLALPPLLPTSSSRWVPTAYPAATFIIRYLSSSLSQTLLLCISIFSCSFHFASLRHRYHQIVWSLASPHTIFFFSGTLISPPSPFKFVEVFCFSIDAAAPPTVLTPLRPGTLSLLTSSSLSPGVIVINAVGFEHAAPAARIHKLRSDFNFSCCCL